MLLASVCSGAEVGISGSSAAIFDSGETQCPASVSTLSLTCTSSFGVTTSGGNATLALGTFTSGAITSFSSNLSFYIIFDTPTGITGGQTGLYNAQVTGQAISDTQNISIVWQNNMRAYSFSDASTTGVFTVTLNDITIGAQETAQLIGAVDFVP